MAPKNESGNYSIIQLTGLILLRMAIGWHFLYEGIAKLMMPGWSAASYLDLSRWIFRDVFGWLAANPAAMELVDFLNIWGLILIGLGLMVGFFARIASMSGMALILLYYVAHPPFSGLGFDFPAEGHYLIIDKSLVEFCALGILVVFPTGSAKGFGLIFTYFKDKIFNPKPVQNVSQKTDNLQTEVGMIDVNRREIVKSLVTLPAFGAFGIALLRKTGWESNEVKHLKAATDAVTGATVKSFNYASLKDLQGTLPQGQIGTLKLSRMILGGNLVGGWAHARDLIYVDKLVKSYHSRDKIFETFLLAEKCGINTFLTNPSLCEIVTEYWKRQIGNIQFISDCAYRGTDVMTGIKMSVDAGAHSCYVQGGIADAWIKRGKIDDIVKALEMIRQNGLPAGIGAHELSTVKACVEHGIKPDYWMKTIHNINYWSANANSEYDNIWCKNPDETVSYMSSLQEPWIAFKVLAAGAIHPNAGFEYAFKNGADFICVGMYDFQIVEDVNIALTALKNCEERMRPWVA